LELLVFLISTVEAAAVVELLQAQLVETWAALIQILM
jgi:hypothetical protein